MKKPTLIPVRTLKDIPAEYRRTPIGRLLEYQNLDRPFEAPAAAQAKLLVGMCMDNRKHLRIPENFAFILRTGGANLRYCEFRVSYAIAIGGIRHIALIAHNNCGMVNLVARKEEFIRGLVARAGWSRERAEDHFMNLAPMHEIENELDFLLAETHRLRLRYPKVMVAPLFYRLEENKLSCIGGR
jgi:carbonic anhydrase